MLGVLSSQQQCSPVGQAATEEKKELDGTVVTPRHSLGCPWACLVAT